MTKCKLGIVGAGFIAEKHLEVIQAFDGVEAIGIMSRTKSKAEALAKQFTIPQIYDSLDDLIKQGKPDALMILVSENQVAPLAKQVFDYGLPLFLEKPAGLNVKESAELIKLADEKNIKNMVGFNRRFYSIFHKGKEIIEKHGSLRGVMVEGHERMWKVRKNPKFEDDVLHHWIYANSTHNIDLLRFFGGDAFNISAVVHSYKEKLGDQFGAVMELKAGAIGHYIAHWYSPGGWRVTLYGEGVTVDFKPLEKGTWTDTNFDVHDIELDQVDVDYKPGFYRQFEAFVNYVQNDIFAWPMMDLKEAHKTLELTQAFAAEAS